MLKAASPICFFMMRKKMKYIRLFLMFQICLLSLISYKVSAETYDSYILKYKDDENVQVITEEEKELLLNNDVVLYGFRGEMPEIEYIEPNYEVFLFDNGDSLNINWNVDMVKVQTPWDYGCYGNEIRVAVIDSGIFKGAFSEKYIEEGYDMMTGSDDTTDNIGHGTFVSSIICGKGAENFAKGISPKVKLIPIKCFDSSYSTNVDMVADAIDYAVNVYDCDVINMSFGLSGNSSYLKEKIDDALSKGVILVAAVGNNGNSGIRYPAAYDGVIGVGAVDENSAHCTFSQYNTSVDVVAPGSGLYGYAIDGYKNNSGTSFSAPHVTAAAAIAKSAKYDITPDEFESLIQETSLDLGSDGYDVYYGYGLLDIEKISLELINSYDVFMSPVSVEDNKAFVVVSNNSDDSISAINIFSKYNDNNKSDGCNITKIKLSAGEKTTVFNNFDGKKVKYFLWDSLKDLKPLTFHRQY